MSWLDELLATARETIRKIFSTSAPDALVESCSKSGKKVEKLQRIGPEAFNRNNYGTIISSQTGGPFISGHGGAPGVQFVLNEYKLELRDGSLATAFKSDGSRDPATGNISSDARMDTDCHGVTFTNGEYWINNDDVDRILQGGGFRKTDVARVGDVLVYRDLGGSVVHSVTVTKVSDTGKVLEVSGLGGIEMSEHRDPPERGWYDPSASREVWTR